MRYLTLGHTIDKIDPVLGSLKPWCAENELVTCHKKLVRDTTGLLSPDWSNIEFMFHI